MIVVNPIMGGLSNAKLAAATATVSQVYKGKTFYASDKTLRTGTLDIAGATATPADVVAGKTFFAGDTAKKTGTRSSGTLRMVSGSFAKMSGENATTTVTLGFRPTYVVVNGGDLYHYILTCNNGSCWLVLTNPTTTVTSSKGFITFTDTGFVAKNYTLPYYYNDYYPFEYSQNAYYAFG